MSHVFISYSREDYDFVELLKQELDKFGFESWWDIERLRGGEIWRKEIDEAIQSAIAVILILSPSAKESEYVSYEWAFALGARVPTLPVIRRPTKLHSRLEDIQYIDFTSYVSRPWPQIIEFLNKLSPDNSDSKELSVSVKNSDVHSLIAALSSLDADTRYDAKDKLESLGDVVVSDLIAALNHNHNWVRQYAAELLGNIKNGAAVEILADAMLQDEDFAVRAEAAEALGKINSKIAESALLQALKDDYIGVRREASKSLGNLQSTIAINELIRLLYDVDNVRKAAAEALGKISDKSAVQPIIQTCLDHPSARVRVAGIRALGQIADPSAEDALIELLEDSEIYLKAEGDPDQLRKVGLTPESFPELFDESSAKRVNDEVADALIRIGTPKSLAAAEDWRKKQRVAKEKK